MLLKLLRAEQWYKNLLIFVALFFSKNLFNPDLLLLTIYGFFLLCLISSSYYIINDIKDRKKDAKHPLKKKRPIASGKIKISFALFLSFILAFVSLFLSFLLNIKFFYSVLALFVLSLIYSFFIKQILFADILLISVNHVIRAISGALLIDVFISPWLILGVFFVSLFLVVVKRGIDKDKYNKDELLFLENVSITCLTLIAALYIVEKDILLFFAYPFGLFCILRLLKLKKVKKDVSNIKFYIDLPLIIAGLLTCLISLVVLYVV